MACKVLYLTAVLSVVLHVALCKRKQESDGIPRGYRPTGPPPRPPPNPAISPSTTATSPLPSMTHNVPPPPLTPPPLLPNQCTFGEANTDSVDNADGYAKSNTLYVLASDPAECTGIVDSFELCYYTNGAGETTYSVDLLAFRKVYSGGDVQSFRKLRSVSVELGAELVNSEGGEASCETVDLASHFRLREGNVLGFVAGDDLNIAFGASDDKGIYEYVPASENRRRELSSEDVSELESFSATELKQANNTAKPVLKIIMNTTNETSSHIIPTPTSMPTDQPDNCDGNRSKRGSSISIITFASAMVASAVVIAVLVVAVFILLCCLCGCCVCCGGCCNCKLCKVLAKCCPCCRKGNGQKVSGIHESMQYNELYRPSDQTTVISRGKKQSTKLHENPAYGQHSTSESSRGLDHTYDSVEVAHTRRAA